MRVCCYEIFFSSSLGPLESNWIFTQGCFLEVDHPFEKQGKSERCMQLAAKSSGILSISFYPETGPPPPPLPLTCIFVYRPSVKGQLVCEAILKQISLLGKLEFMRETFSTKLNKSKIVRQRCSFKNPYAKRGQPTCGTQTLSIKMGTEEVDVILRSPAFTATQQSVPSIGV